MKIQCDKCGSIYKVKEPKIPDKGAYATCKKCQTRFFINRQSEGSNGKRDASAKQIDESIKNGDRKGPKSQPPEDIVCSECGQRQPNFYEKCFKCGSVFNKVNRGTDKKLSSDSSIKRVLSGLTPKAMKLRAIGLFAVCIVCVIGLSFLCIRGTSLLEGTITSIPVDNDSYTYTQYNREIVDWLKKYLWKDYKERGHQSPEFDSKVKSVLDNYALYRLGIYDDEYGYDIQTDLQNIINSGCSDPRLSYIFGNVLFRNGGAIERAKVIVNNSLNALEQSEYPAYHLYFAANKLIRIYEKAGCDDEEILDPLYQKKMRCLARAAADERFRDGNQRYYIDTFIYQFDSWGNYPRGLDKFMEEYEQLEDVDPWIDCMVRGRYHIAVGWEARGGGYANSVTEEGWEVFHRELSTAADYLMRAYELHPDYPEAATYMIHVRMTSAGELSEEEWFLRAVNGQFDYYLAYHMYLQALRPRWGGSHKAMLKFGTACLGTKRFDTQVPRVYLESLREIAADYTTGGSWVKPFQKRGVYKKVQRYFESTLNSPREGLDYYRENSAYALYAWACGEFEDAREIINELGDDFIPEVSEELSIEPKEFINHLAHMS